MKLARFSHLGTSSFGVVHADHVVPLAHAFGRFTDLLAEPARAAERQHDPGIDVAQVAWLPPFEADAKIVCVGFNYATHDGEGERRAGQYPTLFTRYPDSFVGSGQNVWREADTNTLDWEGEVALVIGRPGRAIPPEHAWEHVAGLTIMAENSERLWQVHSNQATPGKNWMSSGACGPWISTLDEVGREPAELATRLNGTLMQQDSTANLVFDPPSLISYISTFTELRVGDVIATGTPGGVGYRQTPPRFLTPGDELEVTVSRVGTLRHGVVDGPTAIAPNAWRSPQTASRLVGGTP
jgi:2-keto-4-pentenoate hydratase/2-oxohepta-3-ene-1,7-dioic acid hydratase in catechol pathway